MRYLLKYFIKRLPREGFKSLSVPALALALVYLINIMGGVKARMEEEYQDAILNYPIYIEVSDGDGAATDGLAIGESYLAQFTDPEALWSLYDFVYDVRLKRTLDIMGDEAPAIYASLNTMGWHEHISYIATDYNEGVEWHGSTTGPPHEVTEASPDPEVSIEPLEGYTYDEIGFFIFKEDEDGGESEYETTSNILISEDLLNYVENGFMRFNVIRRMGPNTRLYGYLLPVSGVVKGPVSGMVFGGSWLHRDLQMAMGQWNATGGVSYLLPDETFLYRGPVYEISIVADTPVVGTLAGITSIESEKTLDPENGASILFYEGFDESIFQTDENVALVSEDVLLWQHAGVLRFPVRSRIGSISDPEAQLRIVGTVSGAGEGLVFAPFLTVSGLGVESDTRKPYTEIMGATISDNLELTDFKQTAMRTFKDVGVFFNNQVFSMTIYDSEFYGITEALMQTIFFIDIATPFVYLIAVCVGFVASFLLTRRRKGEFAMMRSVGVSKAGIFFGALFEQTLLCAVGVALGSVIFTMTWDYVFIERPLIFLGCYMLGAAISAARAAGTDVLRLLRDKE